MPGSPAPTRTPAHDRAGVSGADPAIARSLIRWFRATARDLPWRDRPLGTRRDPYRVLVSELMLQQTQASRVAERFDRFLERFPTVGDLAAADEAEVLALWSGLGYYRRARLLHGAARAIVGAHAGHFPDRAATLAGLPGVGRYTAGAVASLSFLERTPAVDANVLRVILRLEGRELSPSDPRATALCWARAGSLHEAAPRARETPSLLNEALIELGAVVCTPRSPRCGGCPIAEHCRARASGAQGRIPARKGAAVRARLYFASVLVRDGRGRLAVERRPDTGLWAGLYQAPTVERVDRMSTPAEVRRRLGLPGGRGTLSRVGGFDFQTTHRACRFEVFEASRPAGAPGGWRFLSKGAIAELGLSSPQRRILLGDS
ncbi:MAG: A/G-specific adenine glycosylase [Phycisphaerales bacterium]|nr:A/G-specific adenine glycosylase [Phycisphaerales bacterium]